MAALLEALVGPAGRGLDHILSFEEMSTGVRLAVDGTLEIELPNVAATLRLFLDQGHAGGVVLRTFMHQTAFTTAEGRVIPVKEVRGWAMGHGVLRPLPEGEIFTAHCTDHETGNPIAPERGVVYRDAWPVEPAE